MMRSVVAAVLAAATLVLLPTSGAHAADCSGTSGIIVVVDPNQLGGSISKGCDADGGVAADNFADAGYHLEYARGTGMSGFVCKVNGVPADGDCTQADAYWSLWWSDGTDEQWRYATRGVSSLRVPDGGYVAFAWHQGGGRAGAPNVEPTARTASVTPTPPSKGSGGGDRSRSRDNRAPRSDRGSSAAGGDADAKPSERDAEDASESTDPSDPSDPSSPSSPSATPRARASEPAGAGRRATEDRKRAEDVTESAPGGVTSTPSGSELPTIDEIPDAPASADTDDADGGMSTTTVVALVLGLLVLAAAGAVPLLRRRRG